MLYRSFSFSLFKNISAVQERMVSDVGKTRRALFHIGAYCLKLIGAAHQFHLLDGFGEQRRTGIDCQIVEHAFDGTDCLRTLAGDLARDLKSCGARVFTYPRGEAVT